MLATHAPQLQNLPTTNGVFAQGEGVRMCEEVGAMPCAMSEVQVHPTGMHPTHEIMHINYKLHACRFH